MPAYKDKERGTWYVSCVYRDWTGKKRHKVKRGFKRKPEALAWERDFLASSNKAVSMLFSDFYAMYEEDRKPCLKLNTWLNKEMIIKDKILPYFGNKSLNEITPSDVIQWQNKLIAHTDKHGKSYSPTYLRTVNNQLSAMFNHAIRYYGLENRILYWTGIREGELLALTPANFDFAKLTLTINKSYQRLKGKDVITSPKTPKSNRVIALPKTLATEIQEYLEELEGIKPNERMFKVTKYYLSHEMERGSKTSGVKRIRIHDLRHSHVSMLIEMGFSALAIAERLGHESIDITYRYAHLFPNKQTIMAEALDEWRQGVDFDE